jgi:hypothetical protein
MAGLATATVPDPRAYRASGHPNSREFARGDEARHSLSVLRTGAMFAT